MVPPRFPEFPSTFSSGHTAFFLVLTIWHASSYLWAFAHAVPSSWHVHPSAFHLVNLTYLSDHSAEFLIPLTEAGPSFRPNSSTKFYTSGTLIIVASLHFYELTNVYLPHRSQESGGQEQFLVLPPMPCKHGKTFNTELMSEWIEMVLITRGSSSQEDEHASMVRGTGEPTNSKTFLLRASFHTGESLVASDCKACSALQIPLSKNRGVSAEGSPVSSAAGDAIGFHQRMSDLDHLDKKQENISFSSFLTDGYQAYLLWMLILFETQFS